MYYGNDILRASASASASDVREKQKKDEFAGWNPSFGRGAAGRSRTKLMLPVHPVVSLAKGRSEANPIL